MRPLRFAIFVALASAILVALGRLWVRSLDQGSATPVERVLHAGTGAIGVAIAGANRELRTNHPLSTRTDVVGAALVGARTGVRAARNLPVSHVEAAAHSSTTVAVSYHPTVPKPVPTVHRAPAPVAKPKPAPKPAARPAPKPSPAPKPPAPAPTPAPSPAPTPAPGPSPAPTPAPAPPAPEPTPTAPSQPEPTPQPAPTPAPQPPTPPTADDQSQDTRPGWGCGDKNHKHTGPPGHDGPGPC